MSVKKYKMPSKGYSEEEVFSALTKKRKNDFRWQEGKTFSLVFYPGPDALAVVKKAYSMFLSENALNPTAFPSLRQMEMEVVAMTANLFNPTKDVIGNMTSGGTESILLAVKTCRDWFKKQNPNIKTPELVMPDSAHPAFDKACHYFGIKLRRVALRDDFRVNVEAMEQAINENTMMLVGSAVSYPQGVVDPIKEISAIAQKYKLWLHVDGCIGGLVLAFKRLIGRSVPDFDFKLPGVHSMSVDLHKYGYAAKGASVILFKNAELRRQMFFVTTEWPGGIYPSPTILGTKPGGGIAAAWAIMHYLGLEGYKDIAREMLDAVDILREEISNYPDIKVLGEPAMTIFSIASDTLDIYQVGDVLMQKGWLLDKQQSPASLHMTISPAHIHAKDAFLKDLKAAIEETRKATMTKKFGDFQVSLVKGIAKILPEALTTKLMKTMTAATSGKGMPKRSAAMYGMMGSLPNRGDVKEMVLTFMDKLFRP